MMTSYEIVKKAINRERPPRLPVKISSLGVNDTAGIPVKTPEGWEPEQPGIDEWGCTWGHTAVRNMGQVVENPLEDLSKLDSYPMPDYSNDSRYVNVPKALERFEDQGKYVTAGIFMVLFERMHSLHGFENVLMKTYTDRPAMEALAQRVMDVHLTYIHYVGKHFGDRVHAFQVTDDWGTQEGTFVSLGLWRDFFMPYYKKLFDAMHSYDCDVWVHSCGKVNEIVEGYIESGVDVVNLQQPRALGIQEMSECYRGRIAFESLADIQHTLPTDDRSLVEKDAQDLMEYWADETGGFVLSDYGDSEAIGVTDLGIKRYMYECFSRRSEELYGQPLPELP
ncbi:uroporphyrinogen decarboxylase family protein [Candidatus Poribacteria bacterium]